MCQRQGVVVCERVGVGKQSPCRVGSQGFGGSFSTIWDSLANSVIGGNIGQQMQGGNKVIFGYGA